MNSPTTHMNGSLNKANLSWGSVPHGKETGFTHLLRKSF